MLIPQIKNLGWERQSFARRSLGAHVHQDAYEICYIVSGRVDWWAEREIYEVGASDVYITRPNEQHGGVDAVMHPSELYWIVIEGDTLTELPGIRAADCRKLARAYSTMQWRCFPGSRRVHNAFAKILEEHRTRGPLAAMACQAALYDLLVEVLRCAQQRTDADRCTPVISGALQWMREHVTEDFRMDEPAKVAGLTVNHFQNRFREEIGLPPAEWRTRERVRRAKQMLCDPTLSITDIAMRLGYSTSQYFATVFRKTAGLSPSVYRKTIERDGD